METILEVQHLKKNYHTRKEEIVAIQVVSFFVKENEFISIVGPIVVVESPLFYLYLVV